MSADRDALRDVIGTAIKTRTFAPVYYLYGDDDYRKDEAVRELCDAVVDPSTRDFNLEVRRGNELDAGMLGSLLGTPPMMADRRALVVRDVGALKKDARAALSSYLKSPADDAVVILTLPAGGKPDKDLVAATSAVNCTALSGDRVSRWIVRFAKRELDAEITPEAAALLESVAGSDLAQLRVELDKLGSYVSKGAIDEAAVSAVVGVRREESMDSFLDAVGQRDSTTALALLPGVLQQPKASAVTMVMALAVQTLALSWGRAQRDRGSRADFFDLLKKSGSLFLGRSWGSAATAWSKMLDRWSDSELQDALESLLQADIALKESRVSSEEQLMATLVLSICGSHARRAA